MQFTDNFVESPFLTLFVAFTIIYMVGVTVSVAITEDAHFALLWPKALLLVIFWMFFELSSWLLALVIWARYKLGRRRK